MVHALSLGLVKRESYSEKGKKKSVRGRAKTFENFGVACSWKMEILGGSRRDREKERARKSDFDYFKIRF